MHLYLAAADNDDKGSDKARGPHMPTQCALLTSPRKIAVVNKGHIFRHWIFKGSST